MSKSSSIFESKRQNVDFFPPFLQESVTFDPFTTLSVPVPKRTNIDVVFIYRDVSRASRKCRVVMQMDGSIRDLKVHLAAKFNIAYENVSRTTTKICFNTFVFPSF